MSEITGVSPDMLVVAEARVVKPVKLPTTASIPKKKASSAKAETPAED